MCVRGQYILVGFHVLVWSAAVKAAGDSSIISANFVAFIFHAANMVSSLAEVILSMFVFPVCQNNLRVLQDVRY